MPMFGKKDKKSEKKTEPKPEKKAETKQVVTPAPASAPKTSTPTGPGTPNPEPLRTRKPATADLKAGDWIKHKGKRGKVWEIDGSRVILCMEDGTEYVITDEDLDNLARA